MNESEIALLETAFLAYEQGQADRAVELVADLTGSVDALNLLAVIALDQRRFDTAEAKARAALDLDPDHAIARNTLGNTLVEQGRSQEAVAEFDRALRASEDQPDILFNRGNALRQAGQFEDAIQSFRAAIRVRPGYIAAYNNLAVTLRLKGDAESAAAILIEGLAYAPNQPELRFNLGNSLQAAGRPEAAILSFAKAHKHAPDRADILVNWGVALAELGERAEAEAKFREAIKMSPDLSPAYVGLADLADDGTMDGIAHRRAVLDLKPDLAAIRSSLLMCLHYSTEPTPQDLAKEHQSFGQLFDRDDPPAWQSGPSRSFDPERRLRVGFVSGDFRFHAMAFFALPVLAGAPAEAWDVVGYSTTARPDADTQRFQAAASLLRDVQTLSDDELVNLIVADEIDVLIDMSGHAPRNRLKAFAARPAPVQVAWGDYVNTRGLKAIPLLIGDPVHTPLEEQPLYVERVAHMPVDYFCYQPPGNAPDVSLTPPSTRGEPLTFGTFSEITKIQPETVALWAKVLTAVPESRFFANNYLLQDGARAGRLLSQFLEHGIHNDRVVIGHGGPHRTFLDQYRDVDVILDTLPYSGGLTTCEALWMGVPVITLKGDRYCGRHAAAHLSAVGLSDLVTDSPDAFVSKAQELNADAARRATLRLGLRHQVADSPLCNTADFCEAFYGLLRSEWRVTCEAQGNPSG